MMLEIVAVRESADSSEPGCADRVHCRHAQLRVVDTAFHRVLARRRSREGALRTCSRRLRSWRGPSALRSCPCETAAHRCLKSAVFLRAVLTQGLAGPLP